MLWIETTTNAEARALNESIWAIEVTEEPDGSIVGRSTGPLEEGEFWTVALDRVKDDPKQRFEVARRHLPLPAAWREMAIALRAIIRQARKDKVGFEEYLRTLHGLAAISSFAGFGILERIPYARLANLDLSYARIGSDSLELLNKTDGKWMREAWGEPFAHTTAQDLYRDLFEAERKRVREEDEAANKERTQRFFDKIGLKEDPDAPKRTPKAPERRGFFSRLFGR